MSYDGYTASDCCGCYSASAEVREVIALALALDDDGLVGCELAELEAAQDALMACRDDGCAFHGHERLALDALGHAIVNEMERLAELDEDEGPGCCKSAIGCPICVGG